MTSRRVRGGVNAIVIWGLTSPVFTLHVVELAIRLRSTEHKLLSATLVQLQLSDPNQFHLAE